MNPIDRWIAKSIASYIYIYIYIIDIGAFLERGTAHRLSQQLDGGGVLARARRDERGVPHSH